MTDLPPPVPIEAARKTFWDRASIVWLIPLTALVMALWVAWQSYNERGPLITIAFDGAAGIRAEETQLKYREVAVGLVEKVSFSSKLEKVLVRVRLDKDVAAFVDSDAKFWVVQPEVTARGVSGLDTVLSGVYIEGVWDAEPGGLHYEFTGDPQAPLAQTGQSGLTIQLRGLGGTTLNSSSPIIYKGIEVGRMGSARLSEDGSAALAEAIIYAPYDKLISSATRFWDTSGFTFSLGANGAELDFSSLASLISGGITFETIISGGTPVEPGTEFVVHPDEDSARTSLFSDTEGEPLALAAIFDQNVSGLTLGAPVELGGVQIGKVTNLSGVVDSDEFGDDRVRLLVKFEIRPTRMGLPGTDPEEALDFLALRVDQGLRARLATASILTGGLKIELLELPNPAAAEFDREAKPFPLVPTAPGDITDSALTAESVLARVNALPVEDLLASAIAFLDNATALVADEGLKQVPGQVAGLLSDVRGVVGSEDVQALPGQLAAVMADLQAVSADLRALTAQVQEQDGVARLLAAVDAAGAAAEQFTVATEGLPGLLTQVRTLAAKAESLPVEALLADINTLVTSTDALLGAESTRAIPASLNAALTRIDQLAAGLAENDGVPRLLAAIDATAAAATEAGSALEGLPALMTELQALSAKTRNLPLEDMVAQVTAVLASVDAVIASDQTRALPANLNAALTELAGVAAEVNDAEGIARLLAAIDAAGAAAGEVSTSLDGVPALIAELEALSAKARSLPLPELIDTATGALASADTLLGAEQTKALPAALTGALGQVERLVAEMNEAQTTTRLLAAVDAAAAAAASIDGAATGVPDLVARVTALSAKAEALPLEKLMDELTALVSSTDAILGTEAAAQLPASLNTALSEIGAAVIELREGGTVENVNQTLSATERAASAIASSTESLPALIERANRVLAQAGSTIAAFGTNSDLNRDARAALREVEQAAKAVESLSRAIERRPNSLLTGR